MSSATGPECCASGLKQDSGTRFFQCALHALVRDGQDQGVCVYARDITRERENEARFTELFETLQEGVYLATPDGKFEDVNPALARMLGFDRREELIGHPLSDFLIRPESWETEQRELNRSGAIQGHEVTLRCRDGSKITCLHAAAIIRDTGGHVRRHQGTLMNITERREMELAALSRTGVRPTPGAEFSRSGHRDRSAEAVYALSAPE